MRALARLLVFMLALAALLVGGGWALARWQTGFVADLDLPGASHSLLIQIHTGDVLAAQDEPVRERLRDKSEIVAALLDGRLSLREAGDEFRRLNEEKAAAGGQDAGSTAPMSEDAVYENLLAWVNAAAAADPHARPRAAEIRAEAASLLRRPLQGL